MTKKPTKQYKKKTKEIIHVQIGQCGNNIGSVFWETIAKEHGLTEQGKLQKDYEMENNNVDVFFNRFVFCFVFAIGFLRSFLM